MMSLRMIQIGSVCVAQCVVALYVVTLCSSPLWHEAALDRLHVLAVLCGQSACHGHCPHVIVALVLF